MERIDIKKFIEVDVDAVRQTYTATIKQSYNVIDTEGYAEYEEDIIAIEEFTWKEIQNEYGCAGELIEQLKELYNID